MEENEAIEVSSTRLCKLANARASNEQIAAAMQSVVEARHGRFTAQRTKDWEDAVLLFEVGRALQQMLAKMKASEKLTKAATE